MSRSPFDKMIARWRENPIRRFKGKTVIEKKYLAEVQGRDIDALFIGWICERHSCFAYLYKWMKKQASHRRSTRLASEIACAGFPGMIQELKKWMLKREKPIMLVPVPSRHGVSEAFAAQLHLILNKRLPKPVQLKALLKRRVKSVEIKKIIGWNQRRQAVGKLFALKRAVDLSGWAVVLVDDIITSGVSMRKSAALLKKCGAGRIAAISLATNLFDSL